MAITFRCEHCHKSINAPDDAGGKRGKCPYCKQSTYIPAPVDDEELYDLAPVDEEAEKKEREFQKQLFEKERDLIAERGGDSSAPLEHKEDLSSEDLHHLVVNYCLDMYGGKLDRARKHVQDLKKYRYTGLQAVEDFQTGKAEEPVLDQVPEKLREGFLKQLREELK